MFKKNLINVICVIAFLFPLFAFAGERGDEKIKQLGAVKALQQTLEDLRSFKAEKLTETLKTIMLGDPQRYRKRSDARSLLGQWYEQEHKRHLDTEKRRIFSEFGEEGKAFSYEWLSNYAEENRNMTSSIETFIEQNRETVFQPSFDMAREHAVNEQWETINFGIYPEPSEVEELSAGGSASLNQIIVRMERDMSGKTNFFEENTRDLDRIIKRVLEDAVHQYNDQIDVLKKSRGGEHLTEKNISAKTREEINAFIGNLEPIQGRYRYKIFPSIDNAIPDWSEQLAKDKLLAYVNSAEVFSLIDKEAIRSLILKAPMRHKHLVDSIIILHTILLEKFTKDVIETYVQKSRDVDGEVPGFKKWVEALLSEKDDDSKLLDDRMLAIIAEIIPPVRDRIAGEQLGEYFSDIYSRQWAIPEQVIVEYYLTENEITYSERYRPRYSISIDELPSWHQFSNFEQNKSLLLDEALAKLEALLNNDLLLEGYNSLAKQITIIDSQREDMKGKIRYSLDSGNERDTFSHVFKIYKNDVQTKWEKERNKFQPPLGEKYAGIFQYAEELIRSLIQVDTENVKTEINREAESRASAPAEPQDRRVESPKEHKPTAPHSKSGSSGDTCEERINECQKELEQMKGILKALRKGMI
jgi:hypothetical protein